MDGSSRSTQSGGPTTQSGLACNICFSRMPNSPVVAYCGHVFCWPCLYRSWLQAGPAITKSCPVCGTALREGYNIVPIYGFDNVTSPTSGPERQTTTGTTTAAAAAAPDNATSSRPAAPVSSTPIPPRPTAAAFFTAAPRRPHSAAARAAAAPDTVTSSRPSAPVSSTPIPPRPTAAASSTPIPPRPTAAAFFTAAPRRPHSPAARAAAAPDTVTTSRPSAAAFITATPTRPDSPAAWAAAATATAAAPNTAFPPRQAAVSPNTNIPPRPNPPARIMHTQTQTQTDAVDRLRSLQSQGLTNLRHGFLNNLILSGAGNRLRPASSAARDIGSGGASRSIRRRRNLWLSHLRLMNPRGMDGNGGNRLESYRARMDVLNAMLDAIRAIRAEMDALSDAREELEDDLI